MVQAKYQYDYLGRQAIRQLVPGGVTIHSVFGPDGQRIAEYNEASGALIRQYIWLGERPVAVVEGGIVYLIRTDWIGRPAFATTLAGTKVWTASYLPFGGVNITSGAPIDARFPGQWLQAEAGLYQNWMRDYDPTTGRYVEADPLGLVDGASVYGYVGGNPGRYVDPRGLYRNPSGTGSAAICEVKRTVGFPVGDECALQPSNICIGAGDPDLLLPPIMYSKRPGDNGGPPLDDDGAPKGSGPNGPSPPPVQIVTPGYRKDDPNSNPKNWTETTQEPRAQIKPNTTDPLPGRPNLVITTIQINRVIVKVLGGSRNECILKDSRWYQNCQ